MIGNPPYSYRNATEEILPPYYDDAYASAQGNYDLYKFFVERGVRVTKESGLLGFIVSATVLVQPTFSRLREFIVANSAIEQLTPLGPGVFDAATVDTTIAIIRRGKPSADHLVRVRSPKEPKLLNETPDSTIKQNRFATNTSVTFDYRLSDQAGELLGRLVAKFAQADKQFEFGVGINTGYIRDDLVAEKKIDNRYHPMVPGNGIGRYTPPRPVGYIMYDREYIRSRGKLGRTLPAERLLIGPKILVVRTRNLSLSRRIIATLDTSGGYNLNRLSNIINRDSGDLRGLLGVLNSQVGQWIFSTRFYDYEIKPVYLKTLPVPDTTDKRLVSLVDTMLSLHKRLAAEQLPQRREQIQREIDATDRQIDQLVYQLYGLTDEEIKIVEEATR